MAGPCTWQSCLPPRRKGPRLEGLSRYGPGNATRVSKGLRASRRLRASSASERPRLPSLRLRHHLTSTPSTRTVAAGPTNVCASLSLNCHRRHPSTSIHGLPTGNAQAWRVIPNSNRTVVHTLHRGSRFLRVSCGGNARACATLTSGKDVINDLLTGCEEVVVHSRPLWLTATPTSATPCPRRARSAPAAAAAAR